MSIKMYGLKEKADELKNEIERVDREFDKERIVKFIKNLKDKEINCLEKDTVLNEINHELNLLEHEISEKRRIQTEIADFMQKNTVMDISQSVDKKTRDFIRASGRNINDRLRLLDDTCAFEGRIKCFFGFKVKVDPSIKQAGGLRRTKKSMGKSPNYKKELMKLRNIFKEGIESGS